MSGDRFLRAQRLATAMALAEILLVTIVTLRRGAPDGALYAGVLWATLKCSPLLVLLPGLVRGSVKSATWLCFVLCAYFVAAVAAMATPGTNPGLAALELVVILTGFVAGLLATRWGRGHPEPPGRIS